MFVKPGREEAWNDLGKLIEQFEVPPKAVCEPTSNESMKWWTDVIMSCAVFHEEYKGDRLLQAMMMAWFQTIDLIISKRIALYKERNENAGTT